MRIPLKITWRQMDPSSFAEAEIRERAGKLEQFYDDITRCEVTVEMPHKHRHQGNLFSVRIDVTVPGKEIVVQRSPDEHQAHEDPYVAIRDAFDAMRRQLEDYSRIQRGKVKTHDVPLHGEIVELNPDEGYGKLRTPDGREVYFHRNCVIDASFDKLSIGTPLRFTEELGERGPQATTAHVIGKHHPVP